MYKTPISSRILPDGIWNEMDPNPATGYVASSPIPLACLPPALEVY